MKTELCDSTDANLEVARLLIEAKSDVTAKDKVGGSALEHAIFGRHEKLAWMLIEEGCDLEIARETSFLWRSRIKEVLMFLLEVGCDVHYPKSALADFSYAICEIETIKAILLKVKLPAEIIQRVCEFCRNEKELRHLLKINILQNLK